MKNKNAIFIFVIFTISLSLAKIYFIKDFTVNREKIVISSKEKSWTNLEKKQIESQLNPLNIQSKAWSILVDYKADIKKIISKENAKEFFLASTKNMPELVECLRKDLCGLKADKYDQDRTPAHLLLARTLNVLEESIKLQPSLRPLVDWHLITQISGLKGAELQVASMDLLKYDIGNSGVENFLKVAESYTGKAKLSFYVEMSKDLTPEERPLFISTIEKTLAKDETSTVLMIVEQMKMLRLTKLEIATISKALCRFKAADTWSTIKNKMQALDSKFESYCL